MNTPFFIIIQITDDVTVYYYIIFLFLFFPLRTRASQGCRRALLRASGAGGHLQVLPGDPAEVPSPGPGRQGVLRSVVLGGAGRVLGVDGGDGVEGRHRHLARGEFPGAVSRLHHRLCARGEPVLHHVTAGVDQEAVRRHRGAAQGRRRREEEGKIVRALFSLSLDFAGAGSTCAYTIL